MKAPPSIGQSLHHPDPELASLPASPHRCALRFGGTVVAGILGLGALYFAVLCNGLSFENHPPKVGGDGGLHTGKHAVGSGLPLRSSPRPFGGSPTCMPLAAFMTLLCTLPLFVQFIAMTVALVVLTMPLAAGCARWVGAA